MNMMSVVSPFNGSHLADVRLSTISEAKRVIDTARKLFDDKDRWLTKYKRIEILEKTAQIMSSKVEELSVLAAKEGGKPYIDSKVEVNRAINGVKLAIEHLGSFEGKEIAMGHTQSSAGRMAFTFKEPIGVVLSISAFNHPLNLIVHQSVPAIAVGAPVIIKPSEKTPLSAMKFIEILYEAGLPKEWCQLIVCDIPTTQYLATSNKIDYLSFIGSSTVGWFLRSNVAPGVRVGLEHGGVAPVIVEADADIDDVIPALTKGGFYHAGQVCVSVQRVYVHNLILDEVCTKLTISANALKVGDPLDKQTQVGPLISNSELKRVDEWVQEAICGGAKLLCGGKAVSKSLYKPTILLNPPKDAKVSVKEVFGPVVCVYGYNKIDEAIKWANSLEVSFSASIFTKNIDTALYGVKRLNGTSVMVNDHTAFRVDWMPFGGAKHSGLGLGGIPYSMKEMSQEKLMVIKSAVL